MKKLVPMLVCMSMLVFAAHAGPVTLFDTITGVSTNGIGPITMQDYYWGATASFSTGDSPFVLEEVALLLGPLSQQQPADVTSPTMLGIYLFDNDLNPGPGDSLGSIEYISDATIQADGTNVYFFTSSTPYLLDPNTRYWIGIFPTTESQSLSGWGWTWDPPSSVSNEYYWTSYDGVALNRGFALQMKIDGSEVPEPSSLLLAALGVGALAFWRRRSAC